MYRPPTSTFPSKISILSVILHDSEFYFRNLLAFSNFVKIRKLYEFLKFVKFAFSIYGKIDTVDITFKHEKELESTLSAW